MCKYHFQRMDDCCITQSQLCETTVLSYNRLLEYSCEQPATGVPRYLTKTFRVLFPHVQCTTVLLLMCSVDLSKSNRPSVRCIAHIVSRPISNGNARLRCGEHFFIYAVEPLGAHYIYSSQDSSSHIASLRGLSFLRLSHVENTP